MAKLLNKFTEPDKLKHLLAGFIVQIVTTLGFVWFLPLAPCLGLVATIIVGAGKEFRDSMGYGTVDIWDFWFTVIGGAVGFWVVMLIKILL